jgi:acetylornithine deacetylase/succinyl-diaminopimelate desuccinylase-like protein
VWGRGSCDTKGSMASMLAGLHENKAILEELPIAVDFAAFMGEESSQHGSKDFAKKYAQEYIFAIAGEPTMLDLVYVTKGSLWFTLETHGIAAHSSQPERGENAILAMARSLDLMNRKLAGRLASYTHPVLGHSTLNIGTIAGGSRPNIVPDYCMAEVDIRSTPSFDAEGPIEFVQNFIEEFKLPLSIKKFAYNPPMECPSEHAIISTMLQTRTTSKLVGAPWFSDAAHLSAAGTPSIAFGPGSIEQAHTKDEYICVDSLNEGAKFFTEFIRNLGN